MKNKGSNKRILLFTLVGAIIEALVVVLTGAFGISPLVQGLKNAMSQYWQVWAWKDVSTLGFVCLAFLGFSSFLLIVNFVLSLVKKKPLLILPSLALFLSMAFIPFLFLLIFPTSEAGQLSRKALVILGALLVWNFISIYFLSRPFAGLYEAKEKEAPVAQPAKGLSELEIRAIVEDYIELHEEEMHKNQPAPAPVEEVKEEPVSEPVKEEPVPEEPVEEEEEVDDEEEEEEEIVLAEEGEVSNEEFEIVEVTNENGEKIRIKRRRRSSFENKLRRSEYDIRHKYYDLRDYIKWYGLSNRISIPGDSFSYKRRKYAFITIVGKHIKFYIGLDPDKYENSPIPVERATAKKYADIPCVLKIKSDLSYRRAKLLVDDMMKEIGLPKPEGDEPKETQHPEKNK